jgi:hypothetical protein
MGSGAIPVSSVKALIEETTAKIRELEQDAEHYRNQLLVLRNVLQLAVVSTPTPEGETTPLTQVILRTISERPDLTSGQVADYLISSTNLGVRSGSKDFKKTVQTIIGQLVNTARIDRDGAGRLTLPVAARAG